MIKHIKKSISFIGIIFIFSVVSLDHKIKNVRAEEQLIRVIAHRGCTYNAPENTVESILLASKYKADYAEFDVQETKDGVPVLLHDKTLKRTTGVNKQLSELNFSQVEDINVGKTHSKKFIQYKIPDLDDVMKAAKGKIKLDIEIKTYNNATTEDLVDKVVKLIEKNGYEEDCIVTSFNYNALVKVKTLNPKIKTSLIKAGKVSYKSSKFIDIYSVEEAYVNKELIDAVHKDKREIHVWTVDKSPDISKFIKLKVDGIITNDIQRFDDTLVNYNKGNML